MAIAAFATACQVEDLNEANQGQQNGELFTIEAAITPSTKTSLTVEADSYKVDWDAEDALSVVAKYSDGFYSGNEFTKGEGNTFSGTVTNPGDITELNVVYPYDDFIKNIDSEGYFNGYVYLGSRSDESQNQTGLNSAAHINGPLYGYATVSSENTVVQMKHASTLFEINVTNNSGIDINVSNIKLTNSESKNMVGTFYINPQTGALKEGQYVAPTVSLNVSNATITNEETGSFYITSAPFELAANSNITVTVTANGQETEIVKTVPEATSFVAGTVNHLNVKISESKEILPMEIPGSVTFTTNSTNPEYVTVNQDNERYSDGALKLDKTDENIIVFVGNAVGSIDITAKYNGETSSTLDILGSVDGGDYTQIETVGAENGIGTSKSTISTTSAINDTYRYFKFNMTKASGNFSIYELKFNEQITDPYISTAVSELSFRYDETTIGTIEYNIINAEYSDVSVSCDEALSSWFTAEKSSDGIISYTVSANETETARAGNMTISVEGGNEIVIPVSQTGKPAEGTVIDILTADLFTSTGTSYTDFSDVKSYSSAVYAGNTAKNGTNLRVRDKENSGIVTTVSAGKVKSISIEWASTTDRTLNIYGSNTPFSSSADLYGSIEPIATIVYGETNYVTIEGDYAYIGLRSSKSMIELSKIEITWEIAE